MIYAIIITCEVLFWVFIVAGLAARYLLRRPRLGLGLLIMAPITDVVLLVTVAIHVHGGGEVSFGHELAALYLGFSIAYGHRMIHWADVRFAHRFSDGPAPVTLTGRDYTIACWKAVPVTALAMAIAGAVVGLLILLAPLPEQRESLIGVFRILGIILGLEVLWAVSYTIWPKPTPAVTPTSTREQPSAAAASQPRKDRDSSWTEWIE